MDISCLHLGILPHKNLNAVVDIISKHFPDLPFWAQLPNYAPVEGQFLQFTTPIPGIKSDILKTKYYLDTRSYVFQTRSRGIIKDYEDISFDKLKKYRPNSVFFDYFLRIIDEFKPEFAKGQITGPITIGLLLSDERGVPLIENHKVMDLITKCCILQCISQICEMKAVHPPVKPIIFIDEPALGKAVITDNACRSPKVIKSILKKITQAIKENGGIPAISSSSCTDWNYAVESGFKIICINPATQFVTLLNKDLKLDKFLNSGGKIAWIAIPDNEEKIKKTELNQLLQQYLSNVIRLKDFHKLHKSLILLNSIIAVGSSNPAISDTLAEKSIVLARSLADRIQQEIAALQEEE